MAHAAERVTEALEGATYILGLIEIEELRAVCCGKREAGPASPISPGHSSLGLGLPRAQTGLQSSPRRGSTISAIRFRSNLDPPWVEDRGKDFVGVCKTGFTDEDLVITSIRREPDQKPLTERCERGPYKLAQPWRPGAPSITLERFRDYYAKNIGFSGGGRGYANRIDFRVLADRQAHYDRFRAGELDIAEIPRERLGEARALGANLVQGPAPSLEYIGLPTAFPPFDKKGRPACAKQGNRPASYGRLSLCRGAASCARVFAAGSRGNPSKSSVRRQRSTAAGYRRSASSSLPGGRRLERNNGEVFL